MINMLYEAEKLMKWFQVLPVAYKSKIPTLPDWPNKATNDIEIFKKYINGNDNFNIGLLMGKDCVVVDLDRPKPGKDRADGEKTFNDLIIVHNLPETVMARTPGGGRHLFFRVSKVMKNAVNYLPGIDFRAENGQVVACPSINEKGQPYQWIEGHAPWEIEIANLPDWLNPEKITPIINDNILNFKTADHLPKDHYLPAPDGTRNDSLTSLVGELINDGDDYKKVLKYCLMWDRGNKDHLLLKEIETTIKSIFRTHANKHLEEKPEKLFLIERDKPNLSLDHLKVGGLIQQMCEWMDMCAYKAQPILSFANSIAFLASVIGRNYRLQDDTRSNFYALGIAGTGSGKDNSRKCIARLGKLAHLDYLFGAEDVTSGSAILTALEKTERKTVFFPFDEIGAFLKNKTSKNASSHEAEIPSLLTKIYTTSSSIHFGKQFANEKDRPRTLIDQPHISIYGTGNPDQLFKSIGEEMITSGFFGRILCFFPIIEYPTPNRESRDYDPPTSLVTDLYQWFLHKLPNDPDRGDLDNATNHVPQIIDITTGADDIFYEFFEVCEAFRAKYRYNKGLDALWVRAPEIAKKLSLIFTCSLARVPGVMPPISSQMAQDCCEMARILIDRTCIECDQNVLGSDFEAIQKKIMDSIRMSGHTGLTGKDLAQAIRKWPTHARNQAIQTLIDSELIFREKVKLNDSRKSTNFWFLRK